MPPDDLLAELRKLDPSTLRRVLQEVEGRESQIAERLRSNQSVNRLEELCKSLVEPIQFAPGALVQWKPGLKNRTFPAYDVPSVVVEVLDPPLFDDTRGSGSAYFHEPLSLVLGILDDDDELVLFHFDGRRFQQAPKQSQ